MSISLRSNADGSGTILNGSTPVMEVTSGGVVSLPNIAAGSSANQPVNYGQVLGVGQTWQAAELTNTGATFTDGSSKFRVPYVTYTNTTGKPILLNVVTPTNSAASIVVSGIIVSEAVYSNAASNTASAIIPTGATYSVGGPAKIWAELR